MTLAPIEPKHSLDETRIQICSERLRQARISFNLALVITAASAFVGVVGAVQLWFGHVPEGSITASTEVGASVLCFRLAKDANDRLDKLANELKDE
jgi:ABC-type microcin C transport system permease subunit YejE